MHENSIIVPFGKYKGQSLEIMLSDANYVSYQKQQPGFMKWLQDNHIVIYNIFTTGAQQPQDTPEHNRLQARFLDKRFQLAFFEVAVGWNIRDIFSKKIASRKEAVAEKRLALEILENDLVQKTTPYDREKGIIIRKLQKEIDESNIPQSYLIDCKREAIKQLGGDNFILSASSIDWEDRQRLTKLYDERRKLNDDLCACKSNLEYLEKEIKEYQILVDDPSTLRTNLNFENGYDVGLEIIRDDILLQATSGHMRHPEFRIEVKPSVGDDYPAVLRQMKINQPAFKLAKVETLKGYADRQVEFVGIDVLLIGRFESESINIEQLRGIFGRYRIVLLSEIEEKLQSNQ